MRSGTAFHTDRFGIQHDIDVFRTQNAKHLFTDVRVFARHQPGTALDDRHAATKAPIRLRHLDADVTAAEHDQMRWCVVEVKRADMRQRLGGSQSRHIGNGSVCADIDDHLVAAERACAAIVELHLDRLRANEPANAHDEFRAARCIRLHMKRCFAFDHAALAFAHLCHVDNDGGRRRAKVGSMSRQMRNARAPDFILAGQTGDGGA